MVDKEFIEIYRNMLKPSISSWLLKTDYEGMGEQDKEEFERDFDEILDLALIGLKYKAQLFSEDTTSDIIDRQAVIDVIEDYPHGNVWNVESMEEIVDKIKDLPPAQPETLTDKEQRIFLAAMGREEKVCRQVDDECGDSREPYEDSLVRTCHEITRKVKGALWT